MSEQAYSPDQQNEIKMKEDNMLVELQKYQQKNSFLLQLQELTQLLEATVARHLNLKASRCELSHPKEWKSGDFNVCIPVNVYNWRRNRVLLRCPLPYMIGDMDEKIRCDAATSVWIAQNCARVRVPYIWGFGLLNGSHFTARPRSRRCKQLAKFTTLFQNSLPNFVRREFTPTLSLGYLLVDYIENHEGKILLSVWPTATDDQKRQFYHSLSRMLIDLAQNPVDKIGSFTVDDAGCLRLNNRPLTRQLSLLERQKIPTQIPRSRCYTDTVSYFHDLLGCLDSRFEYQPNAAYSTEDAVSQLACLTTLRAILPRYAQKQYRSGPFIMRFTDLSCSNIFVDEMFNIAFIPDMEWCCALPADMQCPPLWIGGHDIDDYEASNKVELQAIFDQFLRIVQLEDIDSILTPILKSTLGNNTHWFMACLSDYRATYSLYIQHLQPEFAPDHVIGASNTTQYEEVVAKYWDRDCSDIIEQKLVDYQNYQMRLADYLTNASCT